MELGTALASAKATFELLQLAVAARDAARIEAATLELRSKLFAMSDIAMAYVERNAALVTRNAALELANAEQVRAIAKLEEQAVERGRYALHQLRPGALAYALKDLHAGPDDPDAEPPHYLCQPCYDKGVKAILQHQPARPGTNEHYTCPEGGQAHMLVVPKTALPLTARKLVSKGRTRDW